ncbi:MAG: DNA polymerase III subunit gamma/tau [Woeseiaceae bacterium]|nr:DNA polymerase III subunit gamma/tau [Woeseiaceae bacterium]
MSYLVLARKWRPKTFADTVGQEHVLKALVNALESGRLHHAYLFAGTRGVGKTTIARILAKALNCETGVTAEPCGVCSACVEIDEGRFVDLIEVDAASKTKVDDTREMLDNVQYAPARGRYKVYLIDEVHMLSKSSFNALLKTLEEPPPHVKFLLATTDPQKLPVTVLSRCLQFNLSRLTPGLIGDRLSYICGEEDIEFEPAAIKLLARAADGSLRDALSLLDQAIAYCGGNVETDGVAAMLGTIDRGHVMRVLRLLSAADGPGILETIEEIDAQFPDYERLLEDLARVLQRVAIIQVIGASEREDEFDTEELQAIADELPAADVQLFYQTALVGRRDLHLAPDPRSGAEMALLRMLAFRPAAPSQAAGGGKPAAKARPQPKAAAPAARKARAPVDSAPVEPARVEPAPVEPAPVAATDWSEPDWTSLIATLGLKGAVRMLADNCAYLKRDGQTIYLGLDSRSESTLTPQRREALSEALSSHFGERLKVDIALDAHRDQPEAETPVERASRENDERYAAARESIESDPNVQALKNMFSAELKSETIEPINPTQSD